MSCRLRPWPTLALLLMAGEARAAGYFTTDAGVRAMGRGAAFAAGVDDASAQYWNPAAVSRLQGLASIQLAGVHQRSWFAREDKGDISFDPVESRAAPRPVPSLGVGFALDEDVSLALGLYSPYAPRWSWPEDGAQRYSVTEAEFLQVWAGPTVSWRVLDGLHVGLGLAWTMLRVQQGLAASISTSASTEDPAYDVGVDIAVEDSARFAWNAGLLYDRGGAWAVGLSLNPPISYAASGSMDLDFSENALFTGGDVEQVVTASSVGAEGVVLQVRTPLVARAGVLLRGSRGAEVELNLVWEAWSGMAAPGLSEVYLEIPTLGGEPIVVDDDVVLSMEFQDAWSARLGGELPVLPALRARGGLFVETSAVAPPWRGPLVPDAPRAGYGLGLSFQPPEGAWAMDLGWSQSLAPESTTTGSRLFQVRIDPSGEVRPGATVGNGAFRQVTTMFGAAVHWRFGAGAEEQGPGPVPPEDRQQALGPGVRKYSRSGG